MSKGVSKKERRRRKAALIAAIDAIDLSPDEAMKALKNELIVKEKIDACSEKSSAEESC